MRINNVHKYQRSLWLLRCGHSCFLKSPGELCDIDTAVRSDMLPQLTAMALKVKRKLTWDPATETFRDDTEANALLAHRPFRGDWKLPAI